jgi:hypothetical protein
MFLRQKFDLVFEPGPYLQLLVWGTTGQLGILTGDLIDSLGNYWAIGNTYW